jgi:ADP-heptose:LPS heptosyltransferase
VIVLTGTPGDAPIVNAVTSNIHEPVFDLTGQTSIPELVALLDACDVVVSGDSGPMHMACAVRTPVVALHGPTDPAISGPVAPDAIVMRQPIWCSPCYDASATAECRFDNPVCMKAIMPRMAYAAVKRQLARQDTTHEQEAETITHTSTQVHP